MGTLLLLEFCFNVTFSVADFVSLLEMFNSVCLSDYGILEEYIIAHFLRQIGKW